MPGWPRAPGTKLAGSPVVTSGNGRGAFLTHHNKNSLLNQERLPQALYGSAGRQ